MSTPTPTGGISSSSYQAVGKEDRSDGYKKTIHNKEQDTAINSDGYKNTIHNKEQDTGINKNDPYIERFKSKSQAKDFVRVTLTTDIVWGQSDEGVNAAYKKHNDFKKTFRAGNIIILLKMTEIFTNGDFGNIRDGIYWCLQQYQNLTNYTQAREKSTRPCMKETYDICDTQALPAGVMPFGGELRRQILLDIKETYDICDTQELPAGVMPFGGELRRQILLDKVGQGSTLADYFDPQHSVEQHDPQHSVEQQRETSHDQESCGEEGHYHSDDENSGVGDHSECGEEGHYYSDNTSENSGVGDYSDSDVEYHSESDDDYRNHAEYYNGCDDHSDGPYWDSTLHVWTKRKPRATRLDYTGERK